MEGNCDVCVELNLTPPQADEAPGANLATYEASMGTTILYSQGAPDQVGLILREGCQGFIDFLRQSIFTFEG